ncbi:MAG: SUMF1/EgtB/PvdO family nonheme iron enzyme [Candidatus Kapabacteria bacterium]|nr:SUMF1/EgtB/PvdO family nonheme iron enzyme [Candidatus Kapabacteria bacterium]
MKNNVRLFSLILAAILFFSYCSNNSVNPPVTLHPVIENLSDSVFFIGDQIIIYGYQFGASQDSSFVDFGGVKATNYVSWTESAITLIVPTTAVTGKLSVTVNSIVSNKVDYTIKPPAPGKPRIDNINPSSVFTGDKVTISGINFGVSNVGFISIAGLRVADSAISSWTTALISFKVPTGYQSGLLTVSSGTLTSNGMLLTIAQLSSDPIISDISPASGKVADQITITGKNLDKKDPANYVTFNTSKAASTDYLIWDATHIIMKVPVGTTTGLVKVTVGSKTSNGINFTLVVDNTGSPVIDSISPNQLNLGDEIKIYGKKFGTTQGTNFVKIQGNSVSTVTLWSDNLIKVNSPVNLSIGTNQVRVSVNSVESNSKDIYISQPLIPMVEIQPGKFTMGSNSGDAKNQPPHEVTISKGFYMSPTEITQAQWKSVMSMSSNPSKYLGDNRPVEQVEWFRALDFCNKLSIFEKKKPVYIITKNGSGDITSVTIDKTGDGYRLPTEAEWEYACRAGTTGDFGGTGKIGDMGWSNVDAVGETSPVAGKAKNAWGLYDMHGNVQEWCWDGEDDMLYDSNPKTDPVVFPDFNAGFMIEVRGGSFADLPARCSSFIRNSLPPVKFNYNTGFRIVRTK